MKRWIRLPSPAMVVALLALATATAGSAYAAATITGKDIKNSSITGKDVKNRSLLARDFKSGQLRRGARGARGPQGSQGPKGDKGNPGTPGSPAQATRWALINEAGAIEEQSGGFTILDAYATNQNVYIDTGRSAAGRGLGATIAIQNQVDVDGMDGDAEPNFAGEISVARCQVTGVVACAPANAQNADAIVVSPRNSDGTPTAAGARKRFYVTVTP